MEYDSHEATDVDTEDESSSEEKEETALEGEAMDDTATAVARKQSDEHTEEAKRCPELLDGLRFGFGVTACVLVSASLVLVSFLVLVLFPVVLMLPSPASRSS